MKRESRSGVSFLKCKSAASSCSSALDSLTRSGDCWCCPGLAWADPTRQVVCEASPWHFRLRVNISSEIVVKLLPIGSTPNDDPAFCSDPNILNLPLLLIVALSF